MRSRRSPRRWLPFPVGKDVDDTDLPSTVNLVDMQGTLLKEDIKVANAMVGTVENYYTERTDKTGMVTMNMVDIYGGSSSFRTVDLLPFAASEFLVSANLEFDPDVDEVEGHIRTIYHSFGTQGTTFESSPGVVTATLMTGKQEMMAVADHTSVEVAVMVTHPQVGDGLSCGADGHYMCAFSTDGSMTKYAHPKFPTTSEVTNSYSFLRAGTIAR